MSQSLSQSQIAFKLRIVTVDHYLSKPVAKFDELYSAFNGCETPRVPVIRIFGVKEDGEKACVHVHGIYPYFCIPFEAERHIDKNSYIRKLAEDLDNKLTSSSFGSKPIPGFRSYKSSNVHKIEIVKSIPFYGYHATEETFLKLSFYNPFSAKKSVDLLSNGSVLNRETQPYFAHIPYILQFFVDYNLNGMNFINFSEISYRQEQSSVNGNSMKKQTCCDIEADCRAASILNASGSSINTGLDLIWEEQRERCRRTGKSSQLTQQASQDRPVLEYFLRESRFQKQIDEILAAVSDSEMSSLASIVNSESTAEQTQLNNLSVDHSASQEYDIDDFVSAAHDVMAGEVKIAEDEDDVEFDDDDDLYMTLEMSQLLKDAVELSPTKSDMSISPTKSIAAVIPDETEPRPSTSFAVQLVTSVDNVQTVSTVDKIKNEVEDDFRWAVETDEEFEALANGCQCNIGECCDLCCAGSSECECSCDGEVCPRMRKKIPQVDGTFDSDTETEEERKTNSECLPAKRKAPICKKICPRKRSGSSTSGESSTAEAKVRRRISGTIVEIDKSLPQSEITRIGMARVCLTPLSTDEINKYTSRSKKISEERLAALQSRCKPVEVSISVAEEELAMSFMNSDGTTRRKQNVSAPGEPQAHSSHVRIGEGGDAMDTLENDNVLNANLPDSTTQTFLAENRALEVMKRHWDRDNDSNVSSTGIYSFYDYGSQESDKNSDSLSYVCSPQSPQGSQLPVFSQSPLVGSQSTSKAMKLSQDSPDFRILTDESSPGLATSLKHSTPRVTRRKGRGKGRRSLAAGDLSAIEVSSQPLEVISEENSGNLSATKNEVKIHKISRGPRIESFLDLNKKEDTKLNATDALVEGDLFCDSFIEGPSRSGTFDFAVPSLGGSVTDSQRHTSPHEFQKIVTMSMELHVDTRGDLKPDPQHDAIRAIFFSTFRDEEQASLSEKSSMLSGVLLVHDEKIELSENGSSVSSKSQRQLMARSGVHREKFHVGYALDELDLILRFVQLVRLYDPEIVLGFEIEMLSWGYLLARASVLNMNIRTGLSRLIEESPSYSSSSNNQDQAEDRDLRLTGRIVLNFWKVLRKEITLNVYTQENCHFHVLHERVASYSHRTLTDWYNQTTDLERWRVFEHYINRVEGSLRMVMKLGIIARTSTLARVYGIQFEEVFTRGSQFRVESMMLRYLKKFNYIPLSPSVRQRTSMMAPEWIPLVMEPESNFYTDPVVVLDFQSLYPSMIIAYNMCYSTCLGRVSCFKDDIPFKFGCSTYYLPKSVLKQHRDNIFVSANGVAFLKENARPGILPQMLEEILNTRVMVKNAIKDNNRSEIKSKSLDKLLDARQLALKLIANVTYGYTAANFSGRMPCVEIADAIVSKGRETLERAIEVINNDRNWGAKVVYGDTDSVFVLFRGATKEEAFAKGREIAEVITQQNPKPVKLKFEKVYYPCVLQSKKRYVGFSYEDEGQAEPSFDAKGIETVRRDGIQAVSKMLEKSIRILFTTKEVAEVRKYVQRQFQKIITGKISTVQDFIFAREYRGRERYSRNACVPALEITKKLLASDPRAEPRRGERVPYVIVTGSPNTPVFQLVRQPIELFKNPSLRLNANYYIERVIIPPLNRVFLLIGEDVQKWFREMPKRSSRAQRSHFLLAQQPGARKRQQTTISQYFVSGNCPVCDSKSHNGSVCGDCVKNPQETAARLLENMRTIEQKFSGISKICMSCTGSPDSEQHCLSLDCPILYRHSQAKMDTLNIPFLVELLQKIKF